MKRDSAMTIDFQRQKRVCLLKALLTAFVFTVFLLAVGACWEENDDYSIAHLLSLTGNDYSPFQWRLLSVILHALFQYIPVVNWWTVNYFLSVSISAVGVTYVIYRRYASPHAELLSAMMLVFLWMTAGYMLNFTRAASVVAMGGSALVADAILHDQKPEWCQYLVGIILLLYGASIRVESALLALGFLAVAGGVWLLADKFAFTADWFRMHTRQIGGLLAAALLFLTAWKTDDLLLTHEQRDYLEYNALRSEIQDYRTCYSPYSAIPEDYQNAGVNEITLEALFGWFSEDTEFITKNVMAEIVKLKNRNEQVFILSDISLNSAELVTLAGIFCLVLAMQKKKNWLFVLSTALFGIIIAFFLFERGRLLARVFDPVCMMSLTVMVFLCGAHNTMAEDGKGQVEDTAGRKAWSVRLGSVACAVLVACTVWQSMHYVKRLNMQPEHIWDSEARKYMREYRDNALGYFNDNDEYVFIYDLLGDPYLLSASFTMWEPIDTDIVDNLFYLGGWDARHPSAVKRLADFGITNPARALIENPRVLSEYCGPRVLDYLRTNYDPRVTVSGLFYGGGGAVNVVQYCAPIDDVMISEKATEAIQIKNIVTQQDDVLNALWFDAQISADENPVRDFYCNVTVDQQRYTFRLHYEDGTLHSAFHGIGGMFDWDQADMRIFERTQDGRYIEYPLRNDSVA